MLFVTSQRDESQKSSRRSRKQEEQDCFCDFTYNGTFIELTKQPHFFLKGFRL